MVVEDFDLYEVLEYEPEVVAAQALTCGTVHDAAADHERTGAEWPVSGDASTRAGTVVHRQPGPFYLMRPPLRGVAGGWLRRATPAAEGVTQVRCADCPWGLDVQGWDERAEVAQKLAQRHAERRDHTIRTAEKFG